jgi:hypothetical protein
MAELRLPIIVENKGKKAFKDVDKGVKGLTKDFKKLAGAAGIGLSTAAVINFGKAAAKAFIADEKAAARLAMSVKNLGLGFETPRIERYISDLSKMSGVTDDDLRPAMQRLLQTTGSVAKSQELLTQALDVSRGSGVDYQTVVEDLSNAYVGNTKGLKKYSLGLTKAELSTMSFAQVQAKFASTFKGGNAAYLDTYAGKFELINTAAKEAQETIGGALVDSLVSAFAAGDPQLFVAKIEDLASKIASMVATAVFGFKKLYYLTSDQAILASLNPFDNYENDVVKIIDMQEKMFRASFDRIKIGYVGSMPVGIYDTPAQIAARKKAEADALKRAKELSKLQGKTTADTKSKIALEKAAGSLDLQRIGLTAALKGQISETDRLALNLQLALLDKNESQASKLTGQLDAAVKRQNDLNAALLATPEAPNPYRNWVAPGMAPLTTQGSISAGGGGVIPDFNVPTNSYSQVGPMGGLGAGVIAGVNPMPPINIVVELDGQAVGGAIRDSQINDSLSGSFSQTNRFSNKQGTIAI